VALVLLKNITGANWKDKVKGKTGIIFLGIIGLEMGKVLMQPVGDILIFGIRTH
jgi:hypothetical protein